MNQLAGYRQTQLINEKEGKWRVIFKDAEKSNNFLIVQIGGGFAYPLLKTEKSALILEKKP